MKQQKTFSQKVSLNNLLIKKNPNSILNKISESLISST